MTGIDAEQNGTDTHWAARLGKLDGIMTAAEIRSGVHVREADEIILGARAAEERLIATAHLVTALCAEATGSLTTEQQQVLDVASAEMSSDSLSQMRRIAGTPGKDLDGLDVGRAAEGPLVSELDNLRDRLAGDEGQPVSGDHRLVRRNHDDVVDMALSLYESNEV